MIKEKKYFAKINDWFAMSAAWVIDHRFLVLLFSFLLISGAVVLAFHVRVDTTTDAYFMDDDPSFVAYLEFLEKYGNDEFVYVVYRADQGVFNLDTLQKTQSLIKDLIKVPYVKKVNGITNIEIIDAPGDLEIKVYKLEDVFPANQKEANKLKEKLLDKPLYVNSYISPDSRYGAILCEMEDKPEEKRTYYADIIKGLNKVLSKQEYQDFKFYTVGMPVLYNTFNESIAMDSLNATFYGSIVILILLFLFYCNLTFTLSISIGVIATIFVMAFMSIFQIPVTIFFGTVGAFLISIGTADAVHIINEYKKYLNLGNDNRSSIIESVRKVGFPCLLTSFTTVVGFASIGTSSLKVTKEYGIYFSLGITIVFLISFSFLLVVLSFSKGEEKKSSFRLLRFGKNASDTIFRCIGLITNRIFQVNKKYYGRTLLISIIILICCIYGVSNMQINTSIPVLLNKTKVSRDIKFIDETMAGSGNLEILLNSEKADGVKTLEFVKAIDKIQNFARGRDHIVNKTTSVVDIIKEMNRAFHNNDKEYYSLPLSDQEVSQYILLYEVLGGDQIEQLVTIDFSEARISLFIKSANSVSLKQFRDELEAFITSVIPKNCSYQLTGASFLSIEAAHYSSTDSLKSISIAIIIISIIMIVVLGSLRVGLISILPNLMPLAFFYAMFGFFDIWLDMCTATMGCIIIGLAVDDTIHFITRYQQEFNRLGNYNKALDISLSEVGRALIITTVFLAAGHSALMTGDMSNMRQVGWITPLSFIVALLADLFIAPSLILFFKPFGKEFIVEE